MTAFSSLPPAPIWRRLLALVYDGLLVLAIWFVTAGVLVPLLGHYGIIPMENFNGIARAPEWFEKWVLWPLLLLEAWAFYAWFWIHGGQTLGMIAWRIKVFDYRQRRIRIWQTLVRFGSGLLSFPLMGVGMWLVWLPPHQSLQDRLSAMETRAVPKNH